MEKIRGIGIALLASLCIGGLLLWWHTALNASILSLTRLGGAIFLRLLSVIIVPLIFTSLCQAVLQIKTEKQLTILGLRTLGFYLLTTLLAMSMAFLCSQLLSHHTPALLTTSTWVRPATDLSLHTIVLTWFPANLIKSLAEGNLIALIIITLFFAIACRQASAQSATIQQWVASLHTVLVAWLMLVLRLAPYGIFCLITATLLQTGWHAIPPLLFYMLTVLLALCLHCLISFGFLLYQFTPHTLITVVHQMRQPLITAFSLASSQATIPLVMQYLTTRLKLRETTTSLVIPMGATVNMDGTAIMQVVASLFIAHHYHIILSGFDYVMLFTLIMMASIGTAGIPGIGLMTLAAVFTQLGLPLEGIGLILGVDRLLDMCRTTVNVLGDSVIACVIDYTTDTLDQPSAHKT